MERSPTSVTLERSTDVMMAGGVLLPSCHFSWSSLYAASCTPLGILRPPLLPGEFRVSNSSQFYSAAGPENFQRRRPGKFFSAAGPEKFSAPQARKIFTLVTSNKGGG